MHLTSLCIWKWLLYMERSTLRSSSACLACSMSATGTLLGLPVLARTAAAGRGPSSGTGHRIVGRVGTEKTGSRSDMGRSMPCCVGGQLCIFDMLDVCVVFCACAGGETPVRHRIIMAGLGAALNSVLPRLASAVVMASSVQDKCFTCKQHRPWLFYIAVASVQSDSSCTVLGKIGQLLE